MLIKINDVEIDLDIKPKTLTDLGDKKDYVSDVSATFKVSFQDITLPDEVICMSHVATVDVSVDDDPNFVAFDSLNQSFFMPRVIEAVSKSESFIDFIEFIKIRTGAVVKPPSPRLKKPIPIVRTFKND
jgi:hypothetical protein